jgi:aryl-alcohol dehydrogenase-like predicted oxidoreductase
MGATVQPLICKEPLMWNISFLHQSFGVMETMAERKTTTLAQMALAWLLAQKPWRVPIPGTKKLERLEENIGATDISFTHEELKEIKTASSQIKIQGERLPEAVKKMTRL